MTFSLTCQGPSKWGIVVMWPRERRDPGWLPAIRPCLWQRMMKELL